MDVRPEAGSRELNYRLELHMSAPDGGALVAVALDGQEAGTITVAGEGWNIYRMPGELPLTPGRHIIQLRVLSNTVRMDWLDIGQ